MAVIPTRNEFAPTPGGVTIPTSGEFVKVPVQDSGIILLDSGTYTLAASSEPMTIPVSLTGTPVAVLVECDAATSGTGQSLGWAFTNPAAFPDWSTKATFTMLANGPGSQNSLVDLANDNQLFAISSAGAVDASHIVVHRSSSAYPILAGDYKWYVWGIA